MNNFTKEEIQHLYREISNMIELYEEPPIMHAIQAKLRSMIDSYCEHPEEMRAYSLGVDYCVKCKGKLNE